MRAFLNSVALATEIEEGTKRTVSKNLNEHSSGIFLFFTLSSKLKKDMTKLY